MSQVAETYTVPYPPSANREGDMKVIAWLSRHDPTPEQQASLSGYRVIKIDGYPVRFMSARDAWLLTLTRCGCRPDVIVAIMPRPLLRKYMGLAKGIPVIRPTMSRDDQWQGRWRRIVKHGGTGMEWQP